MHALRLVLFGFHIHIKVHLNMYDQDL